MRRAQAENGDPRTLLVGVVYGSSMNLLAGRRASLRRSVVATRRICPQVRRRATHSLDASGRWSSTAPGVISIESDLIGGGRDRAPSAARGVSTRAAAACRRAAGEALQLPAYLLGGVARARRGNFGYFAVSGHC